MTAPLDLRSRLIAMTNAGSVEELWAMHLKSMARYGFDRLMYGFTRYRTTTSLGDPNDFVLLTNHSPDYTDVFVGDGLYHHAPMVRWALENEGACSWSVLGEMMAQGNLTEAERRVIEFNLGMEVRAGYSISFKSVSSRAKGAIALTARPACSSTRSMPPGRSMARTSC